MSDANQAPLQWSTQLKITAADHTPKLLGDKIILPPSALEQLLSAATVVVVSNDVPGGVSSNFNPLNPYSYAEELQSRAQVAERRQELPHPLTFRLVNPTNGNIAYAGIREFSANEEEIGLSPFLRQALGLEETAKDPDVVADVATLQGVTVHAQQLPKGTYVRFRPLEAGYDPEDWKALLERYLRNTFTTLTNREIISVPSGKEEYRFLVDKIAPEGDGICIVDTDLEVDIEALNEEQARETLKRRLAKAQRAPGSKNGSSVGGDIAAGHNVQGQVQEGDYVDYVLKDWNHDQGIEIELDLPEPTRADIFVSPLSLRQRRKPREDEHVFADVAERQVKRIKMSNTNSELDGVESLFISVHGYGPVQEAGDSATRTPAKPADYILRVSSFNSSATRLEVPNNATNPPAPDEARCENCEQWIPQRTMILHKNFCYRNNVLCPHCKEVFKKSSSEWKSHWHCPHDEAHGSTANAKLKHDAIYHIPRTCRNCGFEARNIPELAHHRTTTCPDKEILCQFCHLLVPQQGPDDPSLSDPEVLLSGLTPHEFGEGARTTECHMCSKIVRLRDMAIHLKHHNLERLSRITPRICRNANCGRTMDGIGQSGEIKRPRPSQNDIGLCDVCYGPLYNSAFDPDGKALKRRVERKYLTQLLTGCGKDWCRNEYCRTGRRSLGLEKPGEPVMSKEAMAMVKPTLEGLMQTDTPLSLCTDEPSQKRRVLAEMITAEGSYDLHWCIAAFEAESGDLDKARAWLKNWAPTIQEIGR